MNICPSRKYGIDLERVENKSLNSEKLKTLFNMHRLEKTEKLANRLDRYDDKIYERKRKKLREKLNIGERVYVLAERIKKKMHLESSIKKQYRMLVILIKKQFTQLEKERKQTI